MDNDLRVPLEPRKPSAGKVLAIASGKGGVGKSTIAANLAVSCAEAGLDVRLVDTDLPLGNLDILLNIHCRFSLADLLAGHRQLSEVIYKDQSGLEILSAATGLSFARRTDWGDWDTLFDQVDRIRDGTDLVLIDTASGIDRSVLGWCMKAEVVLVVTTPETTSIADAYATIKALSYQGYQGQVYLVVNMAQTYRQGRQVYTRIASVARRFLGLAVGHAATIPLDKDVQRSIQQRRPVVLVSPGAAASTAFRALASRLGRRRHLTSSTC